MSLNFAEICQALAKNGVENPRLETRLIMAFVLQCQPAEVFSDSSLTDKQSRQADEILRRRLQHEPLDKILGHREFYKFDFVVDKSVLSPRPDTEILVEEAVSLAHNNMSILDLGTGSGCIIESILSEFPQMQGTAVDISEQSLDIARRNAANLNLGARLRFIQADWFTANFCALIGQKFDMIVSNPPYIPTSDIAALDDEVKNHDPLAALDGGEDGLQSYKRIAEIAPTLLNNKGYILLEVGINQAHQVADIFTAQGLKLLKIVPDLSGIERCVILQKS